MSFDVSEPWPPHYCVRTTGDGLDLGDLPEGEYTFHYMKGALGLGQMPKDRLLVWFEWDAGADLDARVDFLGRAQGYYCYYKCTGGEWDVDGEPPCPEIIEWYGTPNLHDSPPGQGTSESYGIDLYGTWEQGMWAGATDIGIYCWWWTAGSGSITVNVKWAFQEVSFNIPSASMGDGVQTCYETYQNYRVGKITAYEGGFFVADWTGAS